MKIMLELFIIAVIIVFIIDLSGALDSFKHSIWKRLFKGIPYKEDWRLKPLDCSLCMTWWIGLIYILITSQFSILMVGYIALLAFMTPIIKDIMILLKDASTKLIDVIYKLIN
jgi:hypothetical protein